ncbi:MAG: 50S ribosomal protein L25 [Sedimentibacter sp.]
MSEIGTLKVERRINANGSASKNLRKTGYLPGSVSCRGKDSISITVKADDLKKALASYGRNGLFKLSLDDGAITAMVKEIQLSPIKGDMQHVDLQQVFMNEEIRAELSIRLKGLEALEFKKLVALRQLDEIPVKGLPQNIPDEIVIDVSNVNGVKNITISDIKFPNGIVPESNPEQTVISIVELRMAEENLDETADDKSI